MMPILWIVHYRLAVAAYNASRYELAEASLENYVEVRSKLLQSDPNFGETVYNQVSDVFGDIYFAQSNFADAAKAYQRYLDADINSSVDSSKLDVVKDKLARAQQATTSGQGVPDGALPAPIDACEKFPQLCWQDSDA